MIYVETADAGAFFRFSDTYPKIFGGEMWVAMDPPTGDSLAPQEGILNIRDFTVRGEPGARSGRRRRSAAARRAGVRRMPGVEFSRMRVEFTRTPAASRSAKAS